MNQPTSRPKEKSVTVVLPKITPTKSVIEGWNGTVAGVMALAVSLERSKLCR